MPLEFNKRSGLRAPMPLATTWPELLGRHPAVRQARAMGFPGIERQNLLRSMESTGLFNAGELAEWRRPGPRGIVDLLPLNMRVAGFLEQIAHIESGFSAHRREEMLSEVFAFLAEATGLPAASIQGLFTDIQWRSPGLAEVIADGGLSAPRRNAKQEEVQTPEHKHLLALVAKRIVHDLLIHGKSLRFIYQALPLLRETIDRVHPGLANLYIGFAASLQLMMLLYEGPFPDGAAVRAGRVEVGIRDKVFRISVMGINFPSVFNEIAKGLYEALLHPGMPTAEELGAYEAIFRELTSGPDLEYELMKVGSEASLRIHRGLIESRNSDLGRVSRILSRAGFKNLTPRGEVSMLYRAFARLDPAETALLACRLFEKPLKGNTGSLFRKIIDLLEE